MLPVLIDTDMGVDDALAICLLASCREVQIVAATAVGGNVPIDQAGANLAAVCDFLGLGDVPLGKGADQDGTELARTTDIYGSDGLGEIQLPRVESTLADAGELIVSTVAAHRGKLTILALGPLTNLAALVDSNPQGLADVGQILIMGGAIFNRGNATDQAEFNFYRDPQAASKLLSMQGLGLTLIPLDLTRQVVLDEFHLSHLVRCNKPAAQLAADILAYPMGQDNTGTGAGNIYIHDAVAAAAMLWPQRFLHTMIHLDIAQQGSQAGRSKPTVPSKTTAPPTKILTGVDGPALLEEILLQITNEPFV